MGQPGLRGDKWQTCPAPFSARPKSAWTSRSAARAAAPGACSPPTTGRARCRSTNTGDPRNAAVPQLPAFGPMAMPSIALAVFLRQRRRRAVPQMHAVASSNRMEASMSGDSRLDAAQQWLQRFRAAAGRRRSVCNVSFCSRVSASAASVPGFSAPPAAAVRRMMKNSSTAGECHERPALDDFQPRSVPGGLRDELFQQPVGESKSTAPPTSAVKQARPERHRVGFFASWPLLGRASMFRARRSLQPVRRQKLPTRLARSGSARLHCSILP